MLTHPLFQLNNKNLYMKNTRAMTPEEYAVFQFEMKANMRNKRTGELHPHLQETKTVDEKKKTAK